MKILLVVLTLLVATLTFAQEELLQFEQANQTYRSGDFKKAAQLYEQIQKNGYESPALYYDLGNAYFKINNLPAAILNYERARRLAPNDEDIRYNLRLANLRIVDKIDPIPQFFLIEWWRAILNWFSASSWATTGLICFWAAALMAGLLSVSRSIIVQRMALFIVLVVLLLGSFSMLSAYQRAKAEQNDQSGIVFAPSVSVKSAPDAQSTDLFVLHEGVKVDFLDSVGEWRKIRLADGKIGWLPQESVQTI